MEFVDLPQKEYQLKKTISILAATVVAGTLSVAPAFAGTFGDLNTINASGGVSLSDGLKVDIASGQIQVHRNSVGQLYGPENIPDVDQADYMSNYFTVAYTDGSTVYTIAADGGGEVGYSNDFGWASGTSTATLTDSDRSGTVVNTLTSEDLGDSNYVVLEITYKYTYPDQFINVSTKLTLPTGWTFPTRLYWNTDSTLGGADEGNQFDGTLSNGQTVRGVVSPDGSQIEAFRQVSGQSLNSWSGGYQCAWNDWDSCPTAYGWVYTNTDAPNASHTDTDVDNGFGISTPVVSTAGAHTASFDLLFVGCLDGVEALQCINDQLGLAETGFDATGLALGGFALVAAGAVVVVRRRARS